MELEEEEGRGSSLDRRQVVGLEDADYESQPPVLESVAFFSKGRDLKGVAVNHKYTEEERRVLGAYDSTDYLPPHSQVSVTYGFLFYSEC